MVAPELLPQLLNVAHEHAERLVAGDGITRHAVAHGLLRMLLQPRQRFGNAGVFHAANVRIWIAGVKQIG
jgi:hypothetical protein